MKKLAEPTIDDDEILDLLTGEHLMHLRRHVANIPLLKIQYDAYRTALGNAGATNAPLIMQGVDALKNLLDGYYERRGTIDHLKTVAAIIDDAPLCCPMCGASPNRA